MSTRLRFILAGILTVAAIAVLGALFGNTPEVTPGSQTAAATTVTSSTTTSAAKPAPTKMTEGQEQALGKAQDYLSFTAFSKAKLQMQLVQFDKFSLADAKFAVAHVTVDWQEQAVKAAEAYLSFTHFSRAGLVTQLVQFDHFDKADAKVAVEKAFTSTE